jgi:hypothetical protein
MPKLPRMFNKRTATRALTLLRAAQITKHGYPMHGYFRGCSEGSNNVELTRTREGWEECCTFNRLADCDLVELLKCGPRGGWRYKPTELGELVLDIITQHGPAYKIALSLLPQFEGRMM